MARKKTEQVDKNEGGGIQLVIDQINKQFGQGSIITQNNTVPGIERLSSQCISLDRALGGGWPRGRIIELYGPESSGKTTLALHALAEAQKRGERVAFIDAEHALSAEYATALGVDLNTMLLAQPDCGEDALDIVEMLVRSGEVKVIVVDSVAALIPRAELEKHMGESSMGKQAALMSQAMRKLAGIIHKTGTIVIFINQIRMKIGVFFGNPETCISPDTLITWRQHF